jgi:ribonuclease VapC
MIVDTSVLVAILLDEPEFNEFTLLIQESVECRMSAVSFVELLIVMESRIGPSAAPRIDAFLFRSGIGVEPVTYEQALFAREAFLKYGKGRHPAGLNFGDCFSYALAKATGEPLLFKGDDFSKTDLISAS